jgi:hypothetical protein
MNPVRAGGARTAIGTGGVGRFHNEIEGFIALICIDQAISIVQAGPRLQQYLH